eukprot:3700651-Pyramimonas_sp.AAC.1
MRHAARRIWIRQLAWGAKMTAVRIDAKDRSAAPPVAVKVLWGGAGMLDAFNSAPKISCDSRWPSTCI